MDVLDHPSSGPDGRSGGVAKRFNSLTLRPSWLRGSRPQTQHPPGAPAEPDLSRRPILFHIRCSLARAEKVLEGLTCLHVEPDLVSRP